MAFTALYLTTVAAPYTPATIQGAWDDTSGAVTRALASAKVGGGAITSIARAETNASTTYDVLLYRGVSGPLSAQTLSGTLDVILGIQEANADADFFFHIHAYVTTGDSDTPRGTLLTDYVENTTNEWPTTATGKGLQSAQTLSGVAISDGDRLVVEIGYIARNSHTTSRSGTLSYGTLHPTTLAEASDLTVSSTSVTTLAGSLVFSVSVTELAEAQRVSQLVAEVANEGTSEQRVSTLVVEVATPSGTSSQRLSQVVAEVANEGTSRQLLSQLVIEVASSPAEVVFSNDRVPGLTHIEITLSDGTVEAWSVIPMDDPLDYDYGRKRPSVLAWADIRRAVCDFYGTPVAADFRFTVRDKDLHVLGYLGSPAHTFINRYTVTRSISDPDRRQHLPRRIIFRGPIRSVTPRAGATHEFSVKDYLQERFGPNSDLKAIPRRKVFKDDFPGCETTLVNSSAEGYVVDGALGLTQDLGDGPVPTTVIGVRAGVGTFAADQFTFAGHATVYTVSSSPMDDPETEITINPALTAPIVDGEAITQIPTHRVTAAKGNIIPWRLGKITDQRVIDGIDVGDGRGKSTYVGDEVHGGHTYAMYVWACHGCYAPSGKPLIAPYWWEEAIDNLAGGTFYYNDVAMAMTIGDLATEAASGGRLLWPGYGNWTGAGFTTSYVDRNNRRYVLYGISGIFRDWALGIRQAPQNLGGVAHAVNGWGADSALDGTGTAVRDPHDQFVLLFNNAAWGDYRSGAPLDDPTFPDDITLTLLDKASIARAKAHAATLVVGGFVADWSFGVDNEQITMAEFIKRAVTSMGVEQSWNRKTQFCIDRQIFDEDTAMASAPTLTDERDIKKLSYEIDERPTELFTALPFVHTRDEFGRVSGGWRSSIADFNVADQADEFADTSDIITRYSPSGTKLYSQPLQFYWLSGMNRSTDADEYQQGSDTINAILRYKLTMAKVRVFSLTTWGRGYSIDVFERVWIQHFANVGWRVPRPARVIEHNAQPDRWRVTLKCFDLRNVFGTRTYTLVVAFGAGSGPYYPGTRVTISAGTAPSGTAFDRWVGADVEDSRAGTTTIRMPSADTTVSATFASPFNVIIQVPTGSIDIIGYAPSLGAKSRTITVPTGVSRAAQLLGGAVALNNDSLDIIGYAPTVSLKFRTIEVPTGAVTLTGAAPTVANSSFKTITVPVGSVDITGIAPTLSFAVGYTVAVENGTGSRHAVNTTVVSIAANAAPSGKVFDAWTHATVASPSSSSTTLTVSAAQPRGIELNWNANAASDLVTGYVILWGTTSGVYPNQVDVGNVLSAWLTGLTLGTTYFIVIKAYNATGFSLTPSAEVSKVADSIVVTATYR